MVQAEKPRRRSWLTKLTLLACSAVFVSSVFHTWMVLQPDGEAVPGSPAASGAAASDTVQAIINANLFNAPDTSSDATNDSLPELHGTFAGSGGTQSYAILAEPGQPEKSYKVGDVLPGGGKVTDIESDRVVFMQAKTQHIVYLRPQS